MYDVPTTLTHVTTPYIPRQIRHAQPGGRFFSENANSEDQKIRTTHISTCLRLFPVKKVVNECDFVRTFFTVPVVSVVHFV